MFSGIARLRARSAAWRISLGGTLVFAFGSLLIYVFVARYVEHDIERRTDAWLVGQIENMQVMASRVPAESMGGVLSNETAELEREVPDQARASDGRSPLVFFLQTAPDDKPTLWIGGVDSVKVTAALLSRGAAPKANVPFDLKVKDIKGHFRVASTPLNDGSRIYLGLWSLDQRRVLRNLRWRFLMLWVLNVGLGFGVLFWISRRMLRDVRRITEAASQIGETDLSARVPMSDKRDEAAQLAETLNRMLERLEVSMQQVHTMSGALAHDLRSPLTAIRAKLEMSLPDDGQSGVEPEEVVSAIDEIDRLTEILTMSLDMAEARADALRLKREVLDLDAVMRSMEELYRPSFGEAGLTLEVKSRSAVWVLMDASLLHRMVANLFDNEMKHLPRGSTARFVLAESGEMASLTMEDDGPGFAEEVKERMFEPRVKRTESTGLGLGLAFVAAVVAAHGGVIEAGNGTEGGRLGAWMVIRLPLVRG